MNDSNVIVIDGEKWMVDLPSATEICNIANADVRALCRDEDFSVAMASTLELSQNGSTHKAEYNEKLAWTPKLTPLNWDTEQPEDRYSGIPDGYKTCIGGLKVAGRRRECLTTTRYRSGAIELSDTPLAPEQRIPFIKSGPGFISERPVLEGVTIKALNEAGLITGKGFEKRGRYRVCVSIPPEPLIEEYLDTTDDILQFIRETGERPPGYCGRVCYWHM